MSQVAATIISGYLGSGKTTLLNRLLSQSDARRCAVIVNEFAELGIDGASVVRSDEQLVELTNGCLCCTVRSDLYDAINTILAADPGIQTLLVETTGLADPGPVAATFFLEEMESRVALQSVVCVVDAKHICAELVESVECQRQIAFADLILLNKTDLVSADDLARIREILRGYNKLAEIRSTERCAVEWDEVLERGAFDLSRLQAAEPASHDHAHGHDKGIGSLSIRLDQPLDVERFQAWMSGIVLGDFGQVIRSKGIVDLVGEDRKFVFQGVQTIMDGDVFGPWAEGERRESRIVLIGRDLQERRIRDGVNACIA